MTRGSVAVEAGAAVLTEDAQFHSQLAQTFVLPGGPVGLRFTVTLRQLGGAVDTRAGDAFEVALLTTDGLLPLAGTAAGLTLCDALINVQPDGRLFFAPRVTIPGLDASGGTLGRETAFTATVRLDGLPAGVAVTVFFDLLGFGAEEAEVAVTDVAVIPLDDIFGPVVTDVIVNGGAGQRSMVSRLDIVFSEDVGQTLSASDILLTRIETGVALPAADLAFVYDAAIHTATCTFPSLLAGSLDDGTFRLELKAADITDTLGNPLDGNGDGWNGDDYASDLFRFFGDGDGDHDVDVRDATALAPANLATAASQNYDPRFDYDGDGDVDFLDLRRFHTNYNASRTRDIPAQPEPPREAAAAALPRETGDGAPTTVAAPAAVGEPSVMTADTPRAVSTGSAPGNGSPAAVTPAQAVRVPATPAQPWRTAGFDWLTDCGRGRPGVHGVAEEFLWPQRMRGRAGGSR